MLFSAGKKIATKTVLIASNSLKGHCHEQNKLMTHFKNGHLWLCDKLSWRRPLNSRKNKNITKIQEPLPNNWQNCWYDWWVLKIFLTNFVQGISNEKSCSKIRALLAPRRRPKATWYVVHWKISWKLTQSFFFFFEDPHWWWKLYYDYDPETKQQSNRWKHSMSPCQPWQPLSQNCIKWSPINLWHLTWQLWSVCAT